MHVHLCHTSIAKKVSCEAGRAILLEDVIDNLEADPNYYQSRAVTMELKDGDKLH